MGFFDRLFGRKEEQPAQPQQGPARFGSGPAASMTGGYDAHAGYGTHGGYEAQHAQGSLDDQRAIQRYRYLLQTASPETIEQVHAEAFAKLTPEQRAMVLQSLNEQLPTHERVAPGAHSDPHTLARVATRAEMRQPGTLERSFGGMQGQGYHGQHHGGGMMGGMGGMIAGTLLASIAGAVIGTAIADAFFDEMGFEEPVAFEEPVPFEEPGFDAGMGDFGGGFEEEVW